MNKRIFFRLLVFIILISLIILTIIKLRGHISAGQLQTLLSHYGIWAPLVFIGIYIAGVILFMPGSVLTIAGGLIFGPVFGTIYNLSGAVIGATLAFLIARYLAADWINAKIGGKLKVLKEGVEQKGWKFVAVARLIPLFPFNLLDYALGLTRIRIIEYMIASAIFMLPASFAYTYLGSLGQAAITGKPGEIITKAFIALSLLVIVGVTPWVVKKLRENKLPHVIKIVLPQDLTHR